MITLGRRGSFFVTQAALILTLAGAGPARAMADGFDPPPINARASTEHHSGKVIWVELVTPDLAAAERFYGGLFGWTFSDPRTGDTRYALAQRDGESVAGLVERAVPAGEKRQPAWLTFLAVADVDAARGAVVAYGGKILVQPRTYASRGRQAVFADPQGAVFAVLASHSGDPPDYLAAPGAWIWSSLFARDADQDAGFYQTVFGYDVFDLDDESGSRHMILSSDDYARLSVNQLPADAARRHPHWLNFVRVVDAADSAAKAVALGGRVLVPARVDRHGGKLAVLADPTGAPFGVMEWTGADSKQEPK
jgi:predicted enzyme related to lactoylglutathione lyase